VEDDSKIEVQKISDFNLLNNRAFLHRLPAYISGGQSSGVVELQELAEQLENEIKTNSSLKRTELEEDQPKEKEPEQESEPIEKSELEEKAHETIKLTKSESVPARSKSSSSIRVSSHKVETLINLVSEMVTTQARLSLLAQNAQNSEIMEVAETLEKLTRQLRDNAFEISLIPISSLVTRFQRLIRDLSRELNKDVIFETEGTDTELDKTIIENLSDPLMHLFRNAIDHGLESKDERIAAGKPEQGKLLFKAYYSGTNVYIDISDDGKGIDTEKVKEKAIAKGLINHQQKLSAKQINELIMLPGFSTSENITDISGRGVGMDVVKKNINKIQGDIDIYSESGKGTTFSLKLPLTLSIIDGLLVEIDQRKYIIPILLIKKIAPVIMSEVQSAFNNTLKIHGAQIPSLV
jgi:two-component system chemotaxis sensor kinase CheA